MGVSQEEFDDIVVRLMPDIIKYCYGIMANYHDAEDVAVQSFVRIYNRLHKMEDYESLRAYLYKTAYTGCIDEIRKNKRHSDLMKRYKENTDNTPYTVEDYGEIYISGHLLGALKQLKAEDRALVYGVAVDNKSFREMSYVIGKSEATLRKRYERAKAKMRTYLERKEMA